MAHLIKENINMKKNIVPERENISKQYKIHTNLLFIQLISKNKTMSSYQNFELPSIKKI